MRRLVFWTSLLLWVWAWSGAAVAAVIYQARGTAISGTGAVSVPWPSHATNDIALLFVESAGGEPVSLSTPAGFVAVANSPQATGTTTNGTRISVFWARASSATMAAPTAADPGDHIYARILTYRGAITSGDPWDVTGGGVKATASTSITVTGVTTTVANALVVQVAARDSDSTSTFFSGQTNANLTGITERQDGGTTSGNGGGFTVWDGVKATAGATGNTTATVTSSINAFLTIALKEQPATPGTRFYMQNAAPDIASVTTDRGAWDSAGSVLQRKLSRTKAGAIASKGVGETSATNAYDVLILKLVSEPIPTAQTIAGTLNWVAGALESNSRSNANWHVHAYVTVGDTDVLRGTLVNNYTEAAGTNEWPTTAVGVGPVSAVPLTPVTIVANDRIVIEAGYVARNARTTSYSGTLWYGGTNATDLALNGDETTLPGWWEFNSILFPAVASAPHHIQIFHDGSGQTCRAETLTVKACADAACLTNFNTATVTGNVTWAGSPGGTIPFTIASGGSGQTTVLLPVGTAQTVTLGTSSVSPAQTNPPSTCTNSSGGAACNLVFSSASSCFDAAEVGAAISTPIFTKLAGTPFSLDVLAASSYTGTPQVELVDPLTGSGCSTYTSLGSPQTVTFSSEIRKTLSFTYASPIKEVRVRVTGLAGSSCSTDRFAVRPPSLTVGSSANADATGVDVGATPVIKAGTAFTLNATAIAGYSGTPTLDTSKLVAHTGAFVIGNLAGLFSAANPATGVASGSGFTYDEVGYFKLGVDGVYDSSFTAVDQPNDCTNDFSNSLVGGKYGCKFGNLAATAFFGRFIPDHFNVASDPDSPIIPRGDYPPQMTTTVSADALAGTTVVNVTSTAGFKAGNMVRIVYADESDSPMIATLVAVNASGLTLTLDAPIATSLSSGDSVFQEWGSYLGERMDAQFSLTAVDSGANTTQNYQGAYARLNLTGGANPLGLGAVDTAGPTTLALVASPAATGSFAAGVASITAPLAVTRGGTAVGPYEQVAIGIAPAAEADGVTMGSYDLSVGGGANDHASIMDPMVQEVTQLRYGRMKIAHGYGSERLALPMTVTAQYWNGTSWATNTPDSLTAFDGRLSTATPTAGNVVTANVAALTPCPLPFSSTGVSPLVAGVGSFKLAAPGVACSASVTLNAPSYLPTLPAPGRATFGIYKSPLIYRRENY